MLAADRWGGTVASRTGRCTEIKAEAAPWGEDVKLCIEHRGRGGWEGRVNALTVLIAAPGQRIPRKHTGDVDIMVGL